MNELDGREHQVSGDAIVPVGGKLPLQKELKTSPLLDFLQTLFAKPDKGLRKRLSKWLYSRTRPGFYIEVKSDLHLAYADQRDGHGTQHWWRLFFDENRKETIEQIACGSAIVPAGQPGPQSHNAPIEWGGMYFRSKTEVRIAEALEKRGVLFFANVRGRIGRDGSPISEASGWLTGRLEVDFFVIRNRRLIVLEVDGHHHNEGSQTVRDYTRDRVLLREGIPTARFTAKECYEHPDDVVTEFLNLFE